MYTVQAVVVPQDGLPQDHLVMSILTTFLCFWPLGIMAVLKSIEVYTAATVCYVIRICVKLVYVLTVYILNGEP